jgi:hypothetical protein
MTFNLGWNCLQKILLINSIIILFFHQNPLKNYILVQLFLNFSIKSLILKKNLCIQNIIRI